MTRVKTLRWKQGPTDLKMCVYCFSPQIFGLKPDIQNHDMDYAFSPDLGVTWLNTWGQQIADTRAEEPIVPVSAGITVFSIPKYGLVILTPHAVRL